MCWSWNIFQLTGLGIGVGFFLSVCERTFPFIKHHHGAVLEVFLQRSGERLKPSSCRVPGKYNCMRGQWNKCQMPRVRASDPLRCKVGLSGSPVPDLSGAWVPRCGQGEVERRWHNPQSPPWLMSGHCRLSSLHSFSGRTCPSTRACLYVDPLCTEVLMTYAVDIFLGGFFSHSFLSLAISGLLPGVVRQVSSRQVLWSMGPDSHEPQTELKGCTARPLGDSCFFHGGAHWHWRIRALCGDRSTKTRKMHIYFFNLVGIPFWEPTVEALSVHSFWAVKIFIPGPQETVR